MMNSTRSWSWSRVLYDIAVVLGSFAVLATLMYCLPGNYFLQDLSRNFACYTAIVHLFVVISLLPYCVAERRVLPLVVQALALCCYLPVFIQFYGDLEGHSERCSGEEQSFSILSANIRVGHASEDSLYETIKRLQPDVIGLIELTPGYLLATKLEAYPYRVEQAQRNAFGLGLYSKTPLEVIRKHLGDDSDPALLIELSAFRMRLALLHVIAPISPSLHYDGYLAFRRLMTFARNECPRCVIAGDLNTTPFTVRYQQLLRIGGLETVMAGRGIQATWHSARSILHLPLDHILYKGMAPPLRVERIPVEGSDHDALFAKFTLCMPEESGHDESLSSL